MILSHSSVFIIIYSRCKDCRSQRPRGLRRRSAAARLLRSWVRIPPGARIFVCCQCCVLSGRGLCDELITRAEESYQLWCVVVCDLENLKNEAMTRVGSQHHSKKKRTGIIICCTSATSGNALVCLQSSLLCSVCLSDYDYFCKHR